MSAGDLSLGPLRIANPSPSSSPPPSSPHTAASSPPLPLSAYSDESTSTVTAAQARRPAELLPTLSYNPAGDDHESSSLGFNPDSYNLQTTDISPASTPAARSPAQQHHEIHDQQLNHRRSMPLAQQAQQNAQYSPQTGGYSPQTRKPSGQSGMAGPRTSGMYAQPHNSSTSSGIATQSSYRYRDDVGMSDPSGGLSRSGSRSARQVMGSVPHREPSRNYRQPTGPTSSGNGTAPQRAFSQRVRAPTTGSTSTAGGYDGAEGPHAEGSRIPSGAAEWRDRGAATGTVREKDASGQTHTRQVKKGVHDFTFGRLLGEGSYSLVTAAVDRTSLTEYAVKVLDKRHIIKEKKVKYVNIERDTLNRLTEHPGIVRLYYTFQDERSLYFVLDLAPGGELLGTLKKLGSFDVECTQFYAAQILDSIAYMHGRGVIHRDLKPENVLLDEKRHVKITDFGTAKLLTDPRPVQGRNIAGEAGDPTDGDDVSQDKANSFVGTAEYVSPELLRDKNACKASDLWAFGCIVYQLLAGRPPFKAANEYLTFQKILSLEYKFPDGFPELAKDLVERLLVLDPAARLPVEHIRNHRFFEGIKWGKGLWTQPAPMLKPWVPPPSAPIRLNGASRSQSNGSGRKLANMAAATAMQAQGASPQSQTQPQFQSQAEPQMAVPSRRPQLMNVTELAPPSQLDIEWAPVMKNNNERILKLGNLIVTTSSQANSPTGKNGDLPTPQEKPKFARFFSSNGTKKRERLILITSCARLVVAATGGNEKKAKSEINLAAAGATWKSCVDVKGLTYWCFDTVSQCDHDLQHISAMLTLSQRDKHYTFEDPRATTSDPQGSKYSTQEWLDAVEQAREVAIATSMSDSYSGENMLSDLSRTDGTAMSSPSESMGGDAAMPLSGPSAGERHALRHTLRKNTDDESLKGRRRFSKRHSKSGLAAVF